MSVLVKTVKQPRVKRMHKNAGQKIKDSNGRVYGITASGAIVRLSPLKPHDDKASMKAHKRERQNSRR